MPLDPARVKALFNAALELPDPADRPAFLDRECGDDRALRHRLDELLAANDQPASALQQPLAASTDHDATGPPVVDGDPTISRSDPTASYQRPASSPIMGTIIAGRYKIRQEIGEGGMGTVFLAEQTQPVKRQVALKLIKPGMDSRTVLARFESERQALALMDHPNIAKVLDAGTTDDNRPFFVMELVKGIPLTDYCDQHQLGLPERLNLFRQICSAVQHAHQKGIIHRDLKPSNILVESHDEKPVPKVIDFGLAKATSGLQLTENSLYSAYGSVAGTPLYMAPEQASFNAIDIDTRADIYALGVILYELLTGTTPIQRDTFKRAALDEMLRMVREVEPPTPSSRISSSDTLPNIAASRHTEPVRLSRFVRGDLDWIVMKALSKERQRRYESAIAFAQDIERFTNHEPVTAGPPGAAYRFKKFVRRNRGRVIAASLVLLALVGGVIGTALGLVEAQRQRGIAVTRRKEAEKRLAQKDKANEILLSIFRDLNPKGGTKATLPLPARLGKQLDLATAALEEEATDDPLGVARMQVALGEAQLSLSYPEKAIILFSKARATFTSRLGPDHPDTLVIMGKLAHAYTDAGKLDLVLPLMEETLARMRTTLGPDHSNTVERMGNLAVGYMATGKLDRAVPLLEETLALERTKLGPAHPSTLTTMNNLAFAYQMIGKLDRALPLMEETLALRRSTLGFDHPDTLNSMNDLATALRDAGRFDRALPLFEETLALRRSTLGPDHADTLVSMNNLAAGYSETGKRDQALALREETLALMKAKHGLDHPATLTIQSNLALDLHNAGKLDRALPLMEETLALRRSKLGPDHPDILDSMNNLAVAYSAAGKPERALKLQEETLALMKAKHGPDHPSTLTAMNNVAGFYWRMGKLDRSIPLFEELLKLRTAKSGADHPDTWGVRANLGVNYMSAGRLAEALPLLEGAYGASAKYPSLRWMAEPLLQVYMKTERNDEAITLVRKGLAEGRAGVPWDENILAALLAQKASNLLGAKSWGEAEPLLRECFAIREKLQPDDWRTFNTQSMLGAALLGQKKTTEAKMFLQAGYEGMKARADEIPPQAKVRLGEALDRLIALAEATGKADEAKAWKDERAKLPTEAIAKPLADKKP